MMSGDLLDWFKMHWVVSACTCSLQSAVLHRSTDGAFNSIMLKIKTMKNRQISKRLNSQRIYLLRFLHRNELSRPPCGPRTEPWKTLRSLWIWPLLLCHTLLSLFLIFFLQAQVFRVQFESCVIKGWGLLTDPRRRWRNTDTADCETWTLLYQNYAWVQRIRPFIVYSHGGREGDSQTDCTAGNALWKRSFMGLEREDT